jgi:hypothetical protein
MNRLIAQTVGTSRARGRTHTTVRHRLIDEADARSVARLYVLQSARTECNASAALTTRIRVGFVQK